jgi:hypothetical protein
VAQPLLYGNLERIQPSSLKGAKMSAEIVTTVLIPLCTIGALWLAVATMTKLKQRRIKGRIEQGLADYLRQVKPQRLI